MKRLVTFSLVALLFAAAPVFAAPAQGASQPDAAPSTAQAPDEGEAVDEAPAPQAEKAEQPPQAAKARPEVDQGLAEDRKAAVLEEELKKLEELNGEYRQLEGATAQVRRSAPEEDDRPKLPRPGAESAPKPADTAGAKAAPGTPAAVPGAQTSAKPVPTLSTARIVSGSEEKLANTLYQLRRLKDALEAYQRALKLASTEDDQGWCTLQIAMCHMYLGEETQAVESLGKTIQKYPETEWARQARWQLEAMKWAIRWTARGPAEPPKSK